jgi:hypothetical protein
VYLCYRLAAEYNWCRSRGVCKHEDVVNWQIVLYFDLFTLREFLRNVTLTLPEGLVLIVGLRSNNVCLYYEVIEAIMLADVYRFRLVLNVPLKTVDRQYELYKMVYYLRAFQIMPMLSLKLVMIILVLICCNEPT